MTGLFQVKSRDGTAIGSQKSGAGPPLLLVHGTTADHQRWSAISPQFEQRFSVFAMDRRGRGLSGDADRYDMQREAEDIVAVVDAIGEPVFVLGHSYGGLCSLEGALLTESIGRLILYEPPLPPDYPPLPPSVPDQIQSLVDQGEPEAALEFFFKEVVRMPEQELNAYRRLPMWNKRVALAPTIARELGVGKTYRFEPQRYAALQTPVALLTGGESPPVIRQGMELLDSSLPNSALIVLPGQQHIAMDTNPELFVGEVLSFLSAKDM